MLPGITKTFYAEGRGESGNDQYTVLLLHFDGDYIDYSLGATGPVRTFCRRTGAVRENTGGKFGGRLRVGDTASSNINTPNSVDFDFGSGNFTIDLWVYRTGTGVCELIDKRSTGGNMAPWVVIDNGSGVLGFYASLTGATWDISNLPIGTATLNTWMHVAVVRNGDVYKTYLNGVSTNTVTLAGALWVNNDLLSIGGLTDGFSSGYYFDEIRISKGVARWTANFTPPKAPYGPNPNRDTLLLLHMDDVDGTTSPVDSSVWQRLTWPGANGNVRIYVPGNNLGPGVLRLNDGSALHTDRTADYDFMDNDFTIDWWEVRDGGGGYYGPTFTREYDGGPYNAILCGWDEGGVLKFYWSNDNSTWHPSAPLAIGPIDYGPWTHWAVVRKGNTLYGFKNGILQNTVATSGAIVPGVASQHLTLGYYYSGAAYTNRAWIDELRISKIARYTTNFTVPTIPYGYDPVTYSVVLYITAEGSITDISAWHRPVNNSGVAIDNNTMRFVPNSYLYPSNANELHIRNKDFTIEAWLMARSMPGGNQRFYVHSSSTTDNNNGMFLGYHADMSFDARINVGGATPIALNTGPGAFALWQWHHYAFVRYGDKWSLFIDGVERVNQTVALTAPDFSYGPHIGVIPGGSEWMSGFIDDFKFTNGIALYTNNFTPTAPPATPVAVQPATYFVLSAPGTVNIGQTFTVYINAYNSAGIAVNYNGTIRVTTNNPSAAGPGDIPYNSLYGQGAFNMTLYAAGNPYYIYATDISTTGITGNSNGINVPAPVWHESYNGSAGYQEMYMPAGWGFQANTIEMIGGGSGGGSCNYIYNGGHGGGGGGYVIKYNWLGSNQYVGFAVGGGGGQDGGGGSSWFGDSGVVHAGGGGIVGGGPPYAGDGGYYGGNGGYLSPSGGGAGGGGSSSVGPANHGGNNGAGAYAQSPGGGGGAGGSRGGDSYDSMYGSGPGGNNYQGYGGGAAGYFNAGQGGNGVNGGGGGGGASDQNLNAYWGGHGGHGQEWGANLGGGGGGGAASIGPAGYGGAWGGGGGGAGVVGTGGNGYTGLLRLRWYSP